MTYCNTLVDPLIIRIETEQKSIDEIAGEICGDPTTLQANTEHEDEAGQTKSEQALEEAWYCSYCMLSETAVRKVRIFDSENKNEGKSRETIYENILR